VTNGDGSCPSCWAYKDGPRYVIQSPRTNASGDGFFSNFFFLGWIFESIESIVGFIFGGFLG
jgi:hypothetical protein